MNFSNRVTSRAWYWRGLLLFSLVGAAFSYGFLASQFRWFPYKPLKEAYLAVDAIIEASRVPADLDGLARYKNNITKPTALAYAPDLTDELIAVTISLPGDWPNEPTSVSATQSLEFARETLACVIDRHGRVKHRWQCTDKLWDKTQHVAQVAVVSGTPTVAGVAVADNGDLLATFHGKNTFPFAIGMARFAASGQLLWKSECLAHHNFSIAENGHIFVPSLEIVDSPLPIGSTAAVILSDTGKIFKDQILELDIHGKELSRLSLFDCLVDSGWHGLLIRSNVLQVVTDDPLHLNDVQVLGSKVAARFPGLAATDLLVSMRNINALAIVDWPAKRIKWLSVGSMIGQHSPRVRLNGFIALDNLGGAVALGGTRLVQVDFLSHQPQVLFPREHEAMPDLCRTVNSGHLDVHDDESRALMAVTHEGAVWEVNLETGQVQWEYLVNDPTTPEGRAKVGCALYLRPSPFRNALASSSEP